MVTRKQVNESLVGCLVPVHVTVPYPMPCRRGSGHVWSKVWFVVRCSCTFL